MVGYALYPRRDYGLGRCVLAVALLLLQAVPLFFFIELLLSVMPPALPFQ
jgi:hypothetical protein